MKKIRYLFGGSLNPPGEHHRVIARTVLPHCDELLIVPCGVRPDKAITNDVEPLHRAVMADMTFRGLAKTRVKLFDLENNSFTPTWKLDRMFADDEHDVWHVVGADLVIPGRDGMSAIQREWENGQEIWRKSNFVIITRPGFALDTHCLPPHHRLIEIVHPGMSTRIRQKVFDHESIEGLVVKDVAAYIARHGLYTRMTPPETTRLELAGTPRLVIVHDAQNPEAAKIANRFGRFAVLRDPNLVLVIGGDGTMLGAVRKHWRARVPFFGIKTGHRGYLLNDVDGTVSPAGFFKGRELALHQLPMLYVETADMKGNKRATLAFNDAWVERASGQTARVEVSLGGRVRLADMWCDGTLIATPQASGAYARAMGASPLPVGARVLILAGSNVTRPVLWRPANLPLDSLVKFRALDSQRRPLKGYADGISTGGRVGEMLIRASRIAAAEIAFLPQSNMAEKLAESQFPS